MVNFLIVGAPKSGTTALQHYLNSHPEIFMPQAKEIHFFGSEFNKTTSIYRKNLNIEDYHSFFSKSLKTQIKGEASVFYLYSEDAYKKIYSYNNKMKIIICLRHPVDFLISYHQDSIYVGQEDEPIFKEALKKEKLRKQGLLIPKSNKFPKSLYYSELIKYASHVRNFLTLFGEDQVKIIIFEEFFASPHTQYKSLLDFLGVKDSSFTPKKFKKINPRRNIRYKTINNLISSPPNKLRPFLRLIFPNQELRYKIFSFIRQLNTEHKTINDCSIDEKKQLQQELMTEIEKLEYLLKINLDIWKVKYK